MPHDGQLVNDHPLQSTAGASTTWGTGSPSRFRASENRVTLEGEDTMSTVPAITRAAIEAGHEPSVKRVKNRFILVCTCGWSTPQNMTRKNAYLAVARHVQDVGLAHMGEDPGVSLAEPLPQAGGRA